MLTAGGDSLEGVAAQLRHQAGPIPGEWVGAHRGSTPLWVVEAEVMDGVRRSASARLSRTRAWPPPPLSHARLSLARSLYRSPLAVL